MVLDGKEIVDLGYLLGGGLRCENLFFVFLIIFFVVLEVELSFFGVVSYFRGDRLILVVIEMVGRGSIVVRERYEI